MPKTLGRIVGVLLLFTSLIGMLGLVASSFPTAEADVMPNIVPTTVATIVIPTVTVIVPVYVTITQVITSKVSFTLTTATTATVTTVATATTVSVQSLTETSTRTVTSVRTSVMTAVGVLGSVVNSIFKQYSDVGMLAVGIVIGTTVVDSVIMLAMASRAKELGKDKDVSAQMLEMLQKFEGSVQTNRAKKLEEMLEARLQAERADLGWLAALALVIALVLLLVILVLSSINGVPCFWC